VFAPRFDAPVELRIDGGSSPDGDGFTSTVSLRLLAPDEVGLWRIVGGGPSDGPTWLIEGYAAQTIERVDIRIATTGGRELASGIAPLRYEDGRPGAFGGRIIGLGSFVARVSLATPPTSGSLRVTIRWREPLTGRARSIERIVEIRPNLATRRSVEHDGDSLEGP
jgi:hypothetical protein